MVFLTIFQVNRFKNLMYIKNRLLTNESSGPAGIRTRVRGSGGPYAIQAILQAPWDYVKLRAE